MTAGAGAMTGLSAADQDKILSHNAAELLGLDLRQEEAAA